MMQSTNNQEIEYVNAESNIRQMAAYVIRKARLIGLVVLICVIVALLVTTAQWVSKLTDESYVSPATEYETVMADYIDEKLVLEDDIAALEDELIRDTDYDANSVLMRIDPYNKKYATLIYYINARELTLPDNMTYSSDYTNSLLKTYMLYLSGGDLYAQILESFPRIKNELYIREILLVSRDDAASMITVTVIGSDEDVLFDMLDIVRNGMKDVYTQTSAQIGSHQLTEIRSQTYTVSDAALAEKQRMNKAQLIELKQQLKDKQKELEDFSDMISAFALSPVWLTVAKQLAKSALYTLAGSLVVVILLLALYYMLSDKVLDADKLRNTVRLDILGKISGAKPKKKSVWDKWAAAVGGVRLQTAGREELLALTAQSIRSTMLSRGVAEGGIALVGNVAAEELASVAAALNAALTDGKLAFTIAGDPMREVGAVEKIQACVTAVVIVRQGVSRCSDIMQETARVAAWGKPVLGALLLDADTV